MSFPKVLRVQQQFDTARVDNIPAKVNEEILKLNLSSRLKPGDTVAITGGSRGVNNIAQILKSVAKGMKDLGARPFIFPAMGSHGGGTAEGQRLVLEHYGITESTMGVPIRATMDTVQVGETEQGIPVLVDAYAHAADHIVVVNRIKPHTDFDGEIESGLCKMMAIGLGKQRGANIYHRANIKYGYAAVIGSVSRVVRSQCKILFGLGVVENAYDETALIEAVSSSEIESREKQLLVQAKSHLARIPFEAGDVLVIDEMGKNISGSGMDTNVIGRSVTQRERGPMKPSFTRIVVRDLTEESNGNAVGIGLADLVTKRLVNKIDYRPTYMNAITSTNVEAARIPATFETDREAIDVAFSTCGVEPENSRLVWIKNTLKLDQFIASEAFLDEIQSRKNLKIIEKLGELPIGSSGDLASLL
ncbi:MAG: lactate racemase domain-containing protein [Terriglobia bacterium]